MKAVIYARYSSDNQWEESIEGQIRECTAYCKKNDFAIVWHYIDRALSAKTDNRPDFQRMVKDSAKGLFDVVIGWKLDRFARNRYVSAHYKAQLRKYSVKVLSATENISEGQEGIILLSTTKTARRRCRFLQSKVRIYHRSWDQKSTNFDKRFVDLFLY